MSFSVGASGVWKTATEAHIGAGGVWKNFFASISISDDTVQATRTGSGTAAAQYSLLNTGVVREISNGVVTDIGSWLLAGSAADYECRMTMTSGTNFTGDALSTWLNLGTSRTWALSKSSPEGTNTGTATLEFSPAGSNTPIASATITITARWFAA